MGSILGQGVKILHAIWRSQKENMKTSVTRLDNTRAQNSHLTKHLLKSVWKRKNNSYIYFIAYVLHGSSKTKKSQEYLTILYLLQAKRKMAARLTFNKMKGLHTVPRPNADTLIQLIK